MRVGGEEDGHGASLAEVRARVEFGAPSALAAPRWPAAGLVLEMTQHLADRGLRGVGELRRSPQRAAAQDGAEDPGPARVRRALPARRR
jgi:hypothetical protein